MRYISIGKIVNTHGIQGELRLLSRFEYKEKACNILNNIAYNINRFGIQRLIDKIINKGIDPILEEILKKH